MEMKATVRTAAPCRRTVRIEVPVAAWTARLEEVYRQMTQRAQIPGFRVGHAPMDLVKERFAKQAEEELLHQVVPEAVEAALTQQRLEPVVRPRVTEVGYEPGKPLTMTAEVEVKPEIQPKGYRGLKLTKPVRSVTDPDVEQALRFFQERQAELVPIEGRPAAMEDYLLCDLVCTVNGATVEQAKNQWVQLSSTSISSPTTGETLWGGVVQQLVGAQAAQTLEIPITLPTSYRQPKWAGQPALLRVTVRELKAKRLPPLNDELARASGQWQTLEAMKQEVRQELSRRWAEESDEAVRHEALTALLNAMPAEMPPSLIEAEVDGMVADALAQGAQERVVSLPRQATATAEKGAATPTSEQVEALRRRFRQPAADRVRLLFIIEAIARKEELSVTEEEWQAKLAQLAGASKRPPDDVERWLESQGLLSRLRWQLMQRKVLDLVVSQARIETVERQGSAAERAEGAT